MLSKLKYQPNLILSLSDKIKLAVTGVIGFFADTIGLGSFAVNIALSIMTTAGAMQQPLTTLVFLKHNKIPLKKTLFLSVFGCIGVFIGLPIVSHLSTNWLHGLLLIIMLYNISTITLTYYRKKQSVAKVLEPGPA
jgi:uncharacterized membrane protein YfcA